MTSRERILAGTLGALMPICAIILSLDLVKLFGEESGLTTGHAIGIVIQFIIFLIVGGVVAYMHKDETKMFKLFQIGMATPALLASLTATNGINSAMTQRTQPENEIVVSQVSEYALPTISLVSTAHASDGSFKVSGLLQDVIQGVTGKAYGLKKKDEKKKEKPKE